MFQYGIFVLFADLYFQNALLKPFMLLLLTVYEGHKKCCSQHLLIQLSLNSLNLVLTQADKCDALHNNAQLMKQELRDNLV